MPAVYRFALRMVRGDVHRAEEVLQETMLRAVKSKGQVQDPSRVCAWLLSIAANVWKDSARRTRVQSEEQCVVEELPQVESSVSEELAAQELWDSALAAFDKLPDRQRSVLYLHALENMNLNQIADVLGITKQAAKASLSVARARLSQLLGLPEKR